MHERAHNPLITFPHLRVEVCLPAAVSLSVYVGDIFLVEGVLWNEVSI